MTLDPFLQLYVNKPFILSFPSLQLAMRIDVDLHRSRSLTPSALNLLFCECLCNGLSGS